MTTGAPTPTYPARPRRSRLRTFLPLGIAAWLVLEIWLLTVVAEAASGLLVFLLLLAGLVLGSVVIKRAGRRAFQALNEALQRGGAPASGGGNGLMMLGGLLIMLPGLISDAVGLLLLIPPVQKALSGYAERTFDRKLREATPGSFGDAYQQARMHRPDGKVVQGEVIRDEPGDAPQDPRPPLTR
ncbi:MULTISPECIES: FxsA family membrane protein [unclassified Streptomyces]|uniref:FxsA family membrane protein n=1 Tax=unclassified Streptomyces TaxID=2593676 RepID=UPI002365A55D|nr:MULTISPECIES: FxsA family membrane protein [unclassified Streptomyces]MDF3147412.1 FxsA family protein [Streptomyces sp. T21Q-yed]WDF36628.1 FxsA family protein [Streptomyces sp. T12]